MEYAIGAISMLFFLGFCKVFLARNPPSCSREGGHYFGKWRISGQDAAQVKTCNHCQFSVKIPLD